MTDLALAGGWLALLGAALGACVVARAAGMPSTYVRDALHIGAGVWIVGWPWWDRPALPIAIVALAATATALMPTLARHHGPAARLAARLVRSVTGGDERWTGLVHYTLAYAVFTALGLLGDPFPAAAALLALSLGDGLGGAVGRGFGRHHFHVPGAKVKSLEGSVVVALAAMTGVALAAQLCGRDIGGLAVLGLGVLAAVTEAFAPRSSDNLLIPIAVWIAATLVT